MSIKMSRTFRLRPYNEYRELFSLPKKKDFADLTKNVVLARELERLYKDIDRVEFVVGLFGEDPEDGGLFGDLLSRMVPTTPSRRSSAIRSFRRTCMDRAPSPTTAVSSSRRPARFRIW